MRIIGEGLRGLRRNRGQRRACRLFVGPGQDFRITSTLPHWRISVDSSLCSNHENVIRVYDGILEVISDVLKNGAALAIVSSSTSKPLYVSFPVLWRVTFERMGTSNRSFSWLDTMKLLMVTFPDPLRMYILMSCIESKIEHFRRIRELSGIDYSEMVVVFIPP